MSEGPKLLNSPGHVLKRRAKDWSVRWEAPAELVARGYQPSSVRITVIGDNPNDQERAFISDQCNAFRAEALAWAFNTLPDDAEAPQSNAPAPDEPGYSQDVRKDIGKAFEQPQSQPEPQPQSQSEQETRAKVVHSPGAKGFSLSRDDAIFWIGVAVFGDGLYLVADHPTYGIPLILIGVTLLAWSNRGHMPKPPLRLAFLVLAMVLTIGISGYDLYDRHFGNSPKQETAAIDPKDKWEPLSTREAAALERAIGSLPKNSDLRIVCQSPNCMDLGESFMSVLDNVGWDPEGVFSGNNYVTPIGIVIYQHNMTDRSLADAIEKATNGRLKVGTKNTDIPPHDSLVIGLKR